MNICKVDMRCAEGEFKEPESERKMLYIIYNEMVWMRCDTIRYDLRLYPTFIHFNVMISVRESVALLLFLMVIILAVAVIVVLSVVDRCERQSQRACSLDCVTEKKNSLQNSEENHIYLCIYYVYIGSDRLRERKNVNKA